MKTLAIIASAVVIFGSLAWALRREFGGAFIGRTRPDSTVTTDRQSEVVGIDSPFSSVTIPFKLTEANNISIAACINGSDPLELMFHTAVDSIHLTSTTVANNKSLKLKTSSAVEVQSWGGSAKSEVSSNNRLQIGELAWNDQVIFVDELSGPGTDGKFGPNLFGEKFIEINFDRLEIVLHNRLPEYATASDSKYQRLELHPRDGSLYLNGSVMVGDEAYSNSFMIHSGFGGTILLDDSFVETHQLHVKLKTISERSLKDAFGNVLKTKRLEVPGVKFGENHFTDVPIEIFDGALGNQKVSVLGGGLLKRFNLILDAKRQYIYLLPSRFYRSSFHS